MRPFHVAVTVIALALVATSVDAAPPCTGALAKTCLKPLFRCFKPKGACQGELTFQPNGTARTVQCWANRVRREFDVSATGGTVTYRKANGKACLTGEVFLDASGNGGMRFHRGKKKTWTLVHDETDDSWSVVCGNGKTERYAGTDVAGQPATCGGLGDTTCTAGTCP